MSKQKFYRNIRDFKEDLDTVHTEIGEFFFMVFEPNEPVRFSNSETLYYCLFSPVQNNHIDISILFPNGTVFVNGRGFAMRIYEGSEMNWTEICTQEDYHQWVAPENRALISLLGLELDFEY